MALFALLEAGVEVQVPTNKIDMIFEHLLPHIAKGENEIIREDWDIFRRYYRSARSKFGDAESISLDTKAAEDEGDEDDEDDNEAGVEEEAGSEGNAAGTEDVEMTGPGEVVRSAEVAEDDGRVLRKRESKKSVGDAEEEITKGKKVVKSKSYLKFDLSKHALWDKTVSRAFLYDISRSDLFLRSVIDARTIRSRASALRISTTGRWELPRNATGV